MAMAAGVNLARDELFPGPALSLKRTTAEGGEPFSIYRPINLGRAGGRGQANAGSGQPFSI
jgi:hypothetical protein